MAGARIQAILLVFFLLSPILPSAPAPPAFHLASLCTNRRLDTDGAQRQLAFLHAIHTLAPEYASKYSISGWSAYGDSFNSQLAVQHGISTVDRQAVAVSGACTSTPCSGVATATLAFPLPTISSSCTAISLSDKQKFPFFLRSTATDSALFGGVAQVIKGAGWANAVLITSEDSFGESARLTFTEESVKNGIAIRGSFVVNPNAKAGEMTSQMVNVRETNTKIIVLGTSFEVSSEVFLAAEAAQIAGVEGYVWIGTDVWSGAGVIEKLGTKAYVMAGSLAVRQGLPKETAQRRLDVETAVNQNLGLYKSWLPEQPSSTGSTDSSFKMHPFFARAFDAMNITLRALHKTVDRLNALGISPTCLPHATYKLSTGCLLSQAQTDELKYTSQCNATMVPSLTQPCTKRNGVYYGIANGDVVKGIESDPLNNVIGTRSPSLILLDAMLKEEVDGLSGPLAFDSNGDRVSDVFYVLNCKAKNGSNSDRKVQINLQGNAQVRKEAKTFPGEIAYKGYTIGFKDTNVNFLQNNTPAISDEDFQFFSSDPTKTNIGPIRDYIPLPADETDESFFKWELFRMLEVFGALIGIVLIVVVVWIYVVRRRLRKAYMTGFSWRIHPNEITYIIPGVLEGTEGEVQEDKPRAAYSGQRVSVRDKSKGNGPPLSKTSYATGKHWRKSSFVEGGVVQEPPALLVEHFSSSDNAHTVERESEISIDETYTMIAGDSTFIPRISTAVNNRVSELSPRDNIPLSPSVSQSRLGPTEIRQKLSMVRINSHFRSINGISEQASLASKSSVTLQSKSMEGKQTSLGTTLEPSPSPSPSFHRVPLSETYKSPSNMSVAGPCFNSFVSSTTGDSSNQTVVQSQYSCYPARPAHRGCEGIFKGSHVYVVPVVLEGRLPLQSKEVLQEINHCKEATHENLADFRGMVVGNRTGSHHEHAELLHDESEEQARESKVIGRLSSFNTPSPRVGLVWSYACRGSLKDVLREGKMPKDWLFTINICQGIAKGLRYLHNSSIGYHARLRPSKCLIDNMWTCRLCDFGLTKFRDNETIRGYHDEHDEGRILHWLLYAAPEHASELRKVIYTERERIAYKAAHIAEQTASRNQSAVDLGALDAQEVASLHSHNSVAETTGMEGLSKAHKTSGGVVTSIMSLFHGRQKNSSASAKSENSVLRASDEADNQQQSGTAKASPSLGVSSLAQMGSSMFRRQKPSTEKQVIRSSPISHAGGSAAGDLYGMGLIFAELISQKFVWNHDKIAYESPRSARGPKLESTTTEAHNLGGQQTSLQNQYESAAHGTEHLSEGAHSCDIQEMQLITHIDIDLQKQYDFCQSKVGNGGISSSSIQSGDPLGADTEMSLCGQEAMRMVEEELIGNNSPIHRDLPKQPVLKEKLLPLLKSFFARECSKRPNAKQTESVLRLSMHPSTLKYKSITEMMQHKLDVYSKDLEVIVQERTLELHIEKAKMYTLLQEMLPQTVADKLLNNEAIQPEQFECVSVFFSDIVGFTNLCSHNRAEDIIQMLNQLFTTFDNVAGSLDVIKIETVGDAYMAASGVPTRNGNDHIAEIALLALGLMEEVGKFRVEFDPSIQLQMRCGVNSGPVVSGVIGHKMPHYSIYGDTVNTAARMESSGLALRIQASSSSAQILRTNHPSFIIKRRGMVPVKGKDDIETFWITGHKEVAFKLPDLSRAAPESEHTFK
eukprot:Nk52_evm36s1763 gene=Nk52_evmTU36s1763